MTDLWFVVHGSPAPAGSKKAVPFGRGGRWGVVDANPRAKGWKTLVAQAAGEAMAGRELLRGPIRVTLGFYVKRPKAHYGAAGDVKMSAPAFPTSKPDVLKLARGVEDAMSGVVYGDDAQIVTEILTKRYGPERCEVRVEAL